MDAHAEICRAIDRYRDKAVLISHQIHEHPELKFEERFAAGLLGDAARALGIEVQVGIGGLATALRAEFGEAREPAVAILAEYDALPNGHSCGHNLIAGAALAAVAGLGQGLKRLPGRVVLLGTPGEEGGGGKIILLHNGAFDGVDAALMAHPFDGESCTIPGLATSHLALTFHGKQAHALNAPWDGSSALAAVIQTFLAVGASRLHLRDGERIHGIITNGGKDVGVIPERTECHFLARANSVRQVEEIAARVVRCAEAAAHATATTMSYVAIGGYKHMINNRTIAHHYAHLSAELGVPAPEAPEYAPSGSTDMGDVSHAMPAIHPAFQVAKRGEGTCHEDAFVKHTDCELAYAAMIRVAKALAMTAHDLLTNPALLKAAKTEFSAHREA
jgi:amidohydrolase